MKTKWTWVFLVNAIVFIVLTIWLVIQSPSWATDALDLFVGALTTIASIAMVSVNILLAWLSEKLT